MVLVSLESCGGRWTKLRVSSGDRPEGRSQNGEGWRRTVTLTLPFWTGGIRSRS